MMTTPEVADAMGLRPKPRDFRRHGRMLSAHVAWVAQLLDTIPGSLAGMPDRSVSGLKILLPFAAKSRYHCV